MTGEIVHRERQWVAWWVHLIMGLVLFGGIASIAGLTGEPENPLLIPLLVLIVGMIYAVFMPMRVEVGGEAMVVRFGHLGWPRWRFLLRDMHDARAIEFSPLYDYGGWGIRMRRGRICLNQRGHVGMQFRYGRKTYVVGSDDPHPLLKTLRDRGVS